MAVHKLSMDSGSKRNPSAPPNYSALSVDFPPLCSMPLKFFSFLSKTCPSVALPTVCSSAFFKEPTPIYIKLKRLKNKGTLLKRATSSILELIYNTFYYRQNPTQDTHSSKNRTIPLELD